MANRKISELPTKNTPAASDFMPLVDTSGQVYATKKVTLSSLISGLELVVLTDLSAYLSRDGAQTAGGTFTFSNAVTFSGTVGGSGLSSYVTGKRLDELASPTANVAMNNQRLTGLAAPINPADATTKSYVDSVDTAVRGYVDTTDTATREYIDSVDTAVRGYVDTTDTATREYIDSVDTAVRGYVDTTDTATREYIDSVDTAVRQYVDNNKQILDVKDSVRVATTANITLSGLQTIDDITLVAGDRVLVKNQNSAANNGIYVAASGTWGRSSDANTGEKVSAGMYVFVSEGSTQADSAWVVASNDEATNLNGRPGIVLGIAALNFVQFSGAGQITAGAGLTKTGNTLDVATANVGRIVINSNNIDLATTGVTAGSYGGITVDAYGRITEATNSVFGNPQIGYVLRVGLNGQISPTTTISSTNLPTTGVTEGTYTSVTVDVYGRVIAAGNPVVVATGKTLTANNTVTLTGADSANVNLGAGGTVVYETSVIDGGAY